MKKNSRMNGSLSQLIVLAFVLSIFLTAIVSANAAGLDGLMDTNPSSSAVSEASAGGDSQLAGLEKQMESQAKEQASAKASQGFTGVATFGVGMGRTPAEAIANMKKNQKSFAFGAGATANGNTDKDPAGAGDNGRLSGGDGSPEDEASAGSIGDTSGSDASSTGADDVLDGLAGDGTSSKNPKTLMGMIAALLAVLMAMIKKLLTKVKDAKNNKTALNTPVPADNTANSKATVTGSGNANSNANNTVNTNNNNNTATVNESDDGFAGADTTAPATTASAENMNKVNSELAQLAPLFDQLQKEVQGLQAKNNPTTTAATPVETPVATPSSDIAAADTTAAKPVVADAETEKVLSELPKLIAMLAEMIKQLQGKI